MRFGSESSARSCPGRRLEASANSSGFQGSTASSASPAYPHHLSQQPGPPTERGGVFRFIRRQRPRLAAASAFRCDQPPGYPPSGTGTCCSRTNARPGLTGITAAGAPFWTDPGMLDDRRGHIMRRRSGDHRQPLSDPANNTSASDLKHSAADVWLIPLRRLNVAEGPPCEPPSSR
jgi:hypothetical protein